MHDVLEPVDSITERRPRPTPRPLVPQPVVLPSAGTFDEAAPRRAVLPDDETDEVAEDAVATRRRPGKRAIAALALGGTAAVVVAAVALSSGDSGGSATPTGAPRVDRVAATLSAPLVTQQCTGLSCTFSATSPADGATVRWTFGDGSARVTGIQVRHTYARAGSFVALAVGVLGSRTATSNPVQVQVGGTARRTATLGASGHVLTVRVAAPTSCLPAPYALQRNADGWHTIRTGRLTAATTRLGVRNAGAYRIVLPARTTADGTTCAAATGSGATVRATPPASTSGTGSDTTATTDYSGDYSGASTSGSSSGNQSGSGSTGGSSSTGTKSSGSTGTKSGGSTGTKSGGSTGTKSGSGGTKSGGSGGTTGGITTPITGGLYTPPPPTS